jgi:dTMP kinase
MQVKRDLMNPDYMKKDNRKYHIEFDLEFDRNKSKGLYIVLEGIDGSGKTTQAQRIAAYFKAKGDKVILTREPRKKGIVGDLIQQVLHGDIPFPPKALQYLFSTDRVLHHELVIYPALKKGKAVISDRSFWSAVVYGILDKKENYDMRSVDQLLVSQSILSMYHQFIVPDITFYLKIPFEESLKRVKKKHKTDKKEIYEDKNKLEKVIRGYEWLFEEFKDEITTVDGTGSVDEVTNRLIKAIEDYKK